MTKEDMVHLPQMVEMEDGGFPVFYQKYAEARYSAVEWTETTQANRHGHYLQFRIAHNGMRVRKMACDGTLRLRTVNGLTEDNDGWSSASEDEVSEGEAAGSDVDEAEEEMEE